MKDLINWSMTGSDIENESFRCISEEYKGPKFNDNQWPVVRRLIHTTADFSIADFIKFSDDAIKAGQEAVKDGVPIYSDSNMIRSGLSRFKLSQLNDNYKNNDSLICPVADPEVKKIADKKGITRSLAGVEKCKDIIDGGIVLIGNAPTALGSIAKLIDKGEIMPRLVIAMPVGFVHVEESKEMISQCSVPQIVMEGRRGGSTLAVATLHGILEDVLRKN